MSIFIAVDFGGTRLRAAAFPEEGYKPLQVKKIPTPQDAQKLQNELTSLITSLCPPGEKIAAVGVAAPGPLNPYSGIIYATPNIPALRDFPLASLLADALAAPVRLDNDANLAALGEWVQGAGRGHNDLLYLTISTGIGGGVVCGGRLLHGARGLGAELGHVTVLPGGPRCSCGQRGHLEAIASGPAIVRWLQTEIQLGAHSTLAGQEHLTARQVAEAARAGDTLAQAAFQRAGEFIGQALADFLHIFNPSIVVLGGGVSQSANLFLPSLEETLAHSLMSPQFSQNFTLTTAALGDDAGLIGALCLARGDNTP